MEGVGEGINGPLGIATIVVGRSDTCFANNILTIHDRDGESREKMRSFFFGIVRYGGSPNTSYHGNNDGEGEKEGQKTRRPTFAKLGSNRFQLHKHCSTYSKVGSNQVHTKPISRTLRHWMHCTCIACSKLFILIDPQYSYQISAISSHETPHKYITKKWKWFVPPYISKATWTPTWPTPKKVFLQMKEEFYCKENIWNVYR